MSYTVQSRTDDRVHDRHAAVQARVDALEAELESLRPQLVPTSPLRDQNLARLGLGKTRIATGYGTFAAERAVGVIPEKGRGALGVLCDALGFTPAAGDSVPPQMSFVLGRVVESAGYRLLGSMRNGEAWRGLLPLAVNTGRDKEAERFALVANWAWDTVVPLARPLADSHGFGAEWRRMCENPAGAPVRAAERAARRARLWPLANSLHSLDYACTLTRRAGRERLPELAARHAGWAAAHLVEGGLRICWILGDTAWAAADPVSLLRRLVEA